MSASVQGINSTGDFPNKWILNRFELQEDRNEMANEIKILDDRHQRNHEDLDNRRDSDAQFNKTAILKLGEYQTKFLNLAKLVDSVTRLQLPAITLIRLLFGRDIKDFYTHRWIRHYFFQITMDTPPGVPVESKNSQKYTTNKATFGTPISSQIFRCTLDLGNYITFQTHF